MPERKDPHLAPWWSAATKWRSGGFDRILEPTAYAPTRDQLRAWVCVHTIVQLLPGRRDAYLAAVGDTLQPLLEARGFTLMGAYAAPMRSDEALVLWAATGLPCLLTPPADPLGLLSRGGGAVSVEPEVGAIAEGLRRMQRATAAEPHRMGERARQIVASEFSWQRSARILAEAYARYARPA